MVQRGRSGDLVMREHRRADGARLWPHKMRTNREWCACARRAILRRAGAKDTPYTRTSSLL